MQKTLISSSACYIKGRWFKQNSKQPNERIDTTMVKPRPMHKKNGLLLAEMTRRGFTIQTLADAIDVHYLTIWRIVNQEHNPGHGTATKITQTLDVDLERLGLQVWGTGRTDNKETRGDSLN